MYLVLNARVYILVRKQHLPFCFENYISLCHDTYLDYYSLCTLIAFISPGFFYIFYLPLLVAFSVYLISYLLFFHLPTFPSSLIDPPPTPTVIS
jgi:hypothetical protein